VKNVQDMSAKDIAQLVEQVFPTTTFPTAGAAFADLINLAEKSGWQVHVTMFCGDSDTASKLELWGILAQIDEPGADQCRWMLECDDGRLAVLIENIVSITLALDEQIEDRQERLSLAPVLRIYGTMETATPEDIVGNG